MKVTVWAGLPNTCGKLYTLKEGVTLEQFIQRCHELNSVTKGFLFKACKKPGMRSLEKWTFDSVCKSVGGKTVEPDGYDINGYPSWLLVCGII